eukprot:350467-Chlamydomonas_euryale.AAC.2
MGVFGLRGWRPGQCSGCSWVLLLLCCCTSVATAGCCCCCNVDHHQLVLQGVPRLGLRGGCVELVAL